jgi:hypothetical protein
MPPVLVLGMVVLFGVLLLEISMVLLRGVGAAGRSDDATPKLPEEVWVGVGTTRGAAALCTDMPALVGEAVV